MDYVASQEKLGACAHAVQAETIGGMRLIQLVGLEIEAWPPRIHELVQEIEGYEMILADNQRSATSSRRLRGDEAAVRLARLPRSRRPPATSTSPPSSRSRTWP
jgi:DNA gyrase/topoisomerase IV subunit A